MLEIIKKLYNFILNKIFKIININFIKIEKDVKTPTKGTKNSASYDISTCKDMNIPAHCANNLLTGISVEIPKGYFGLITIRNSITTKKNLQLANCVGIIDSDYRGEIIIPLYNNSDNMVSLSKGESVAQMIILPIIKTKFTETKQLSKSKYRNNQLYCYESFTNK